MDKMERPDEEWQRLLSPEQYKVLRHEGTERAGTSPLNDEKRKGTYECAGCGQPLFTSDMKFDSGTGWLSFYTARPGARMLDETLQSRQRKGSGFTRASLGAAEQIAPLENMRNRLHLNRCRLSIPFGENSPH